MRSRFKVTMRTRHILEAYSFIIYWIIGFILFMAIPLGRSLLYSFQNLEVTTGGLKAAFIGLTHFHNAFTVDVDFLPTLISTISTMLTHVPLILIFALFSALLLNRPLMGRSVFRSIFFLPVIIVSGPILQRLLEQGAATLPIFSQYDFAKLLMKYVPPEILVPLLKIMDSLTLVMWDSGVQILIFLAALQSIPPSLFEAAKCDGATPWESFWKITFPMIIPMILVNTLFSIVNSFTKVNNKMMLYINDVMFQKTDYGYAASLGWIYFIIIFGIIGIVFYIFRERQHDV